MSLFKKKKKEEPKKSENQNLTEFEQDIIALMARDDIQCRPEICEAEYKKAIDLFETGDSDKCHRAYDLMGNLATQLDYTPAMVWMGHFAEDYKNKNSEAVYWFKLAAENGDADGARCYADMLFFGNGVQQDQREAMKYYQIAADKGIPEAAFVMGELLRGMGKREEALASYQKVANKGYEAAKVRISQMKNGQK